ncbi:MAG: hypothetical protein WC679_02125 [Bacteroidales bacterium]|jgi:hypothetical protein
MNNPDDLQKATKKFAKYVKKESKKQGGNQTIWELYLALAQQCLESNNVDKEK